MSGSGKSTLLDAVNGFRPATHGVVYVNGIDLYRNFDLFATTWVTSRKGTLSTPS